MGPTFSFFFQQNEHHAVWRRHGTIDWDHKLIRKLYNKVIIQVRSRTFSHKLRYHQTFLQPVESPPADDFKKAGSRHFHIGFTFQTIQLSPLFILFLCPPHTSHDTLPCLNCLHGCHLFHSHNQHLWKLVVALPENSITDIGIFSYFTNSHFYL